MNKIIYWLVNTLIIASSIYLLVLFHGKIWVFAIVIILIIAWGSYWGWREENVFHKVNHIPRWVTQKAKQISRELVMQHESEVKKDFYLEGKWFIYRLRFRSSNMGKPDIFRKGNKK